MAELFSQKNIISQLHDLNALPIVPPTTLVPAVLQQMQQTKASCVLVAENQRLLGILTERDVVRILASRNTLSSLPISALMSAQVITLRDLQINEIPIIVEKNQ